MMTKAAKITARLLFHCMMSLLVGVVLSLGPAHKHNIMRLVL